MDENEFANPGDPHAVISEFAGKVTDGVGKMSDQATATVTRLADKASSAYDRAASGAQKAGEVIEPFARERPYATIGIAAAVGLVIGLLMAVGSPKVVYVRPTH